jgi:diguanylate cyclase (GGDEF)-like protein
MLMTSARARHSLLLVGVFAAYVGLGKLGVVLGGTYDGPGAVWPPSGFALAAMILAGRKIWPAILAGSIFVHFTETADVLTALPIGAGNVLEAIVGSALVERYAGGTSAYQRTSHIFRFTAIAGLVAAPLSASISAATPMLAGRAEWIEYPYVWMTFWLGSLTGMLVVAPLVLLWAAPLTRPPRLSEATEGIGLLAALAGVGLVVFGGFYPSDVKTYPLEFICVPFFLWACFRFGRREAMTAVATLAALAAWGTFRGYGPFAQPTADESLVLLQAYTSVMAVMVAVLASIVAEHHKAEAQLHELAITDPLTGLVNYRRLLEVLRQEIARSNRSGRPFAVLFVDMNGLKAINDQYGHLVGSRALCRVADALRKCCRNTDTAARFGGDEFAVVLPETGGFGGRLVLDRVQKTLAADIDKPALAVSGGVAVFPGDGDSPTMLLRAADQALYDSRTSPPRRRVADASGS